MENVNLLFVDDEPAILRSVSMQFRKEGKVFTAESGTEAIAILRENRIHVLVSDQRMPNMTGVELLQEAKEMAPNTLRILLTGYADLAAIVGSVNEGEVYQYVNKPWDKAHLTKVVREAAEISLQAYLADSIAVARVKSKLNSDTATEDQKSILIIDDDEGVVEEIKKMFEENFNVVSASNLRDAAVLLKTQPIFIVIAELRLKDGFINDFVAGVRQRYPSVRIVIQSNVMDSAHAINLINQGHVFRYLPKPLKKGLLMLGIKSAETLENRAW